jgi:hypothetical protein
MIIDVTPQIALGAALRSGYSPAAFHHSHRPIHVGVLDRDELTLNAVVRAMQRTTWS